jgi:hypothetical protein
VLQFGDGGFGPRPERLDEAVGLELKLVYPRLGIAQLGRQRVREGRGAVAIFVRQIHCLLQPCHDGIVGQLGVLGGRIVDVTGYHDRAWDGAPHIVREGGKCTVRGRNVQRLSEDSVKIAPLRAFVSAYDSPRVLNLGCRLAILRTAPV